MKNPITAIFDTCENPRILCKAIRRTFHISQRIMAKRLLTCQSSVCRFETGQVKRYLSQTEYNRLWFNLKIDFEETISNMGDHQGRAHAVLTIMQTLIEYLRLTTGKDQKDRKDVIRLLNRFAKEYGVISNE